MQRAQIDIVRDTFVHALFEPDRAAKLFYDRLFEIAPDTRALFSEGLDAQARRLIDALSKIVVGLARPDVMYGTLSALAIRHVGYGVEERHYQPVGEALLHMVREMVGSEFDGEAEAAWSEAYGLISRTMIDAACPIADRPGD